MQLRCVGRTSLLSRWSSRIFSPEHYFPRLCLLAVCFAPAFTFCFADEIKGARVEPGPLTPAQQEYQKGLDFLTANHLIEAEASFQRSMKLDPKLVGPWLRLAEVKILQGNAVQADKYLQQAVLLAPRDADVLTARGHYLFFQKHYAEAEKAFQSAIAVDAHMERPHYELGDLYLMGLHDANKAIAAYHDALAINPNNFRVHYSLANVLAETGKLDDAQVQIEEACRLAPKNSAMLIFLGNFYLRRGKLDQAQSTYAKALSLDPNSVAAHMGQGDLSFAKGDFNQALAQYQDVLQIAPGSSTALLKVGIVNDRKGQWNQAEQAYRKALNLEPKSALAANNLAWLLNEHQNKAAEALMWAKKAVQLAPRDFNAQDTYGWVLRTNGDSAGALTALKKANALAPGNPQVLYHLGVLYQDAKQPQAAAQSFARALEVSMTFDGAADAQSRLDAIRGAHSRAAAQ